MKRVLRFLIRLYPAWWRRRYGRELEALMEDSGSRWRDVWDLFRAAVEVQMSRWSFGRIVMACGIGGVVVAGAVVFSMPYRYRSTAVLQSQGDRSPDDWSALAHAAFTPQELSNIMSREHLYADARMEDGIDRMRRAIRLAPAGPNLVQVSFADEDPVQAQRVSQELVGRMIVANRGPRANPNGLVLQLAIPADQPTKQVERKRYGLAGLGLPAGMLFGVVLALILRLARRAEPSS